MADRWPEKEMQLIKEAAKQFRVSVLKLAFDLHNGGGLKHRETNVIVKKLRRARNKMVKFNKANY